MFRALGVGTVGLIDGMEILVVGFTKSQKIQKTQY